MQVLDQPIPQLDQMMERANSVADELDTLTLGFAINDKGKTYLDVEITAKTDTETAKTFALIKSMPSNFGGFRIPAATATFHAVRTVDKAQIEQATTAIEQMHARFAQEIGSQDLPEDQITAVKKLVDNLAPVITKTIKAGKSDVGAALWLDADTAAIVVGGVVVDGDKLENALRDAVDLAVAVQPDKEPFFKLNAGEHAGVSLHTFTMPVPPSDGQDKIVNLIGKNIEVVVGTSSDTVYVAAGRGAMDKLKAVIDKLKANAGKEALPMRVSLAVTPLVRFLGEVADDDSVQFKVGMITGLLEKAGSDDHIIVTVAPIKNGVRGRLQVEEGIIKVLGILSNVSTQGMGPMP
jgi:hypothetical protein